MDATANRKHKDTLFAKLLSDAGHKQEILDVYNAINGTEYTDPGEIEILKVGDCFFLGRENDSSFLIGTEFNLWEEQSWFCPNMPVRGLGYFARMYEEYIATRGLNVYSGRPLKLPTPKYVVFYIGGGHRGDGELKFTDLVQDPDGSAIEVRARVIDITYDDGKEILRKSSVLRGYSILIAKIREYRKAMPLKAAIQAAIRYCIDYGILERFLMENREVAAMTLFGEMSEDEILNVGKKTGYEEGYEEGHEEGHEEGLKEGREEALFGLVHECIISPATGAARLGISEAEFLRRMDAGGHA